LPWISGFCSIQCLDSSTTFWWRQCAWVLGICSVRFWQERWWEPPVIICSLWSSILPIDRWEINYNRRGISISPLFDHKWFNSTTLWVGKNKSLL
jgi:hypothetical protein